MVYCRWGGWKAFLCSWTVASVLLPGQEELLVGWVQRAWWEQGCCSLAGAVHSLVMVPGDISSSLAPLLCSPAGEGRTEPASCSIEMHQNNAKHSSHSFITIKGRDSIQKQVQLLVLCCSHSMEWRSQGRAGACTWLHHSWELLRNTPSPSPFPSQLGDGAWQWLGHPSSAHGLGHPPLLLPHEPAFSWRVLQGLLAACWATAGCLTYPAVGKWGWLYILDNQGPGIV